MPWADAAARLRKACVEEWPTTVTFLPKSGGNSTICGVIETPGMLEDVLPANVIRFWVDYDCLSPQPLIGDQITFDKSVPIGVVPGIYDIADVLFRPEGSSDGGATLKLRRTS